MWYPVCGMVHIKDPLLLIETSSPYPHIVVAVGFFSISIFLVLYPTAWASDTSPA